MSQIHSNILPNGAQLGIWKFEESLNDLMNLIRIQGLQKLTNLEEQTIKSDRRRKEVLSIRLLLNQMQKNSTNTILYDKWGKPYLSDNGHKISISHCSTHSAIVLHPNLETGIDIETLSPRIKVISQRFMHEDEWSFFNEDHELSYLNLIWAAKECIYKINGRHGVIFKDDIQVKPFQPAEHGRLHVTLKKNNLICDYHLHYQNDGEKVLVYGWQEENACHSIESQ
ncbi:MAG: 4'-phosphopantetheinyl transferase superfamily protein [Bacteroidia bacterium]|nr:4'-phosphopantetheinyl transferase superfamily protein [Bacteroidia bacterium]